MRDAAPASVAVGRVLAVGDELYLWLLVIVEVFALMWLRAAFRSAHGG
jgi:hypothetical protein